MRFLLILFFSFSTFFASGTTVTALNTGSWGSGATWDLDVPGCYDTIVIPAGLVVTINSSVNLNSCPPVFIWVKGELHFQTGKKIDLSCGSVVYMDAGPPAGRLTAGGGGGSSNYVKICGVTYWRAADGDLTGPTILCDGCSLPIDLVDFSAEKIQNEVHVSWITASETNNAYFVIQRSQHGQIWQDFEKMDGAGNSISRLNYSIIDPKPFLGTSYYRLVQVDFDEKSEIFEAVSVHFESSSTIFYPNPVSSNSFVTLRGENSGNSLQILTLTGQVCDPSMLNPISGNVGDSITYQCQLPAGVYIIVLGDEKIQLVVLN